MNSGQLLLNETTLDASLLIQTAFADITANCSSKKIETTKIASSLSSASSSLSLTTATISRLSSPNSDKTLSPPETRHLFLAENSSPIEQTEHHNTTLLPFMKAREEEEEFIHKQLGLEQKLGNMLSTAVAAATAAAVNTTNNQQQQSTTASTAGSTSTVPSPASIKNIKCEPFSELSPENANLQNQLEDNSNNNNNNNITNNSNNALTGDSVGSMREQQQQQQQQRDGSTSSSSSSSNSTAAGAATGNAAMLRQNSNSSINSGPNPASSPLNGCSDHSNSSNISANLTQSVDNSNAELLQELNGDKSAKKNNKTNNSSNNNINSSSNNSGIIIKEEDNGKSLSSAEKLNNAAMSSTKNAGCTTPNLSAVKDEPSDVLNNMINIKKEENTLSPVMSPVGFGTLVNLPGNGNGGGNNTTGDISAAAGRAVTPAKMHELSTNAGGNNNNNEKISPLLCGPQSQSNLGPGCHMDNTSGPGMNAAGLANDMCGGNAQHPASASNAFNNNNATNAGGGGSFSNCMDYMQQQNHIFVFSTQLANKGAESVLGGQFPTIIAYHCTQPATKSFLEDFFLKNPMKMTKLQRQNPLNICNIGGMGGGGGGNAQQQQQQQQLQWLAGISGGGGGNPNMQKFPLKAGGAAGAGGKMNFGPMGNMPMDSKPINRPPPQSPHNMPGFPDAADALAGNENDLMCWDQARNNLELNAQAHGMKMMECSDAVMGGGGVPHNVNKALMGIGVDTGADGIPSLQGVKVPDENLTPQQRQHREEQLAKLKKMNQFLFPENGNDFRADPSGNQLGKLASDGVVPGGGGNLAGIMLNMPGNAGMGPQMGNHPLNPQMRQMAAGLMGPNKNMCNPDGLPPSLGDGVLPGDILGGGHDMSPMQQQCNTNKMGPNMAAMNGAGQSNLAMGPGGPGGPGAIHGGGGGNGNMGGGGGGGPMSGPNSIPPCHMGPGGLMPNSPDGMGGFNPNCGPEGSDISAKALSAAGIHGPDINHVGMSQMEWTKLQHHYFEERLKGGNNNTKSNGPPDMHTGMPTSVAISRSNSTSSSTNANIRSGLPTASANSGGGGGGHQRNTQGPPPPYHPTQRSASVPIATKSPNPASPNNPTSNLSLPSPRTSGGALGIAANSPNMDIHASAAAMSSSASSTTSPAITNTTTTTTAGAMSSNTNAQAKGMNFQQDGSPTGGNLGNSNMGSSSASANRNNRNNLSNNQFNSNPSTPLSHVSPKDLDSFHASNTPTGDMKNPRPSPQRSRTPGGNSNIMDTGSMEGNFPSASPGLNFPANSPVTGYKGPGGPMERQNSVPPAQFCRRNDNLPLNPNSNRPPPNKMSHSFDPISSLAQMSQQLTSCVSLNTGGVGNSPGSSGGMGGVMGLNDMNMPGNLNQNQMESMMGAMHDAGMEHCGPGGPGGNMGMPSHMGGGGGPFMSNNCHINQMLGPMGQRLLNPKMCGGFPNGGVGGGGGMREGPGNFHGVMGPSHRMMSRMPVNFGNFNVSPNIQVKASTPNTIQYMPVRPQNSNNTNNNMRVQPSLEFLQRFANPNMAGGGNPNMMDNGPMGQGNMNAGSPIDHHPSKMGNNNMMGGGNGGMNYFPNCNQLGGMNPDQDDLPAGMLPTHDMNLNNPMIRAGMRPMRQQSMGGLGGGPNSMGPLGPRMQGPPVGPANMVVQAGLSQFGPGGPQDPLDCPDAANMFGPGGPGSGNPVGGGGPPNQMFGGPPGGGPGVQQQKSKGGMGGGGLCQNMNAGGPNVGGGGGGNGGPLPNPNLIQNEHNNVAMPTSVNGPMLMGPNGGGGGIMTNALIGGNNMSPVQCNNNPGGNPNYKNFVGPTSNDLKYAQQYHSFQQQLYATSTRSQIGGNPLNAGNNVTTNPPSFFVNK